MSEQNGAIQDPRDELRVEVRAPADLLSQLRPIIRKRDTLGSILRRKAVVEWGKGKGLSENQKGLVATTVSLMQDDMNRLLEQQASRMDFHLHEQRAFLSGLVHSMTSGFLGGVREVWKKPLIHVNAEDAGQGGGGRKSFWARLKPWTNWGNLASVAGVIIAAVAAFTTHATFHYKDRATLLETEVSELRTLRNQLDKDLEEAASQNGNLEGELSAAKDERDRLLGEKSDLEIRLGEFQRAAGASAVEGRQLENELASLKVRLQAETIRADGFNEQVTDLEEKLRQANGNYERVKKRAEKAEDRVAKLFDANRDLSNRLDKRKSKKNQDRSRAGI